MKTFAHTFSAGETITLPGGVHLELISAPDSVNVTYFKGGQALDEKALAVPAGYYFTMPKRQELIQEFDRQFIVDSQDTFEKVEVYSATAQSVLIGITRGDGGARSTATNLVGGNIDLVKAVTPNAPDDDFFVDSSAGSLTLRTIVTPAANVNGVRVDGMGTNSASGEGRAMMKTSAPTAWDDTSAVTLFIHQGTSSGPEYKGVVCPFIVPAGYGLYYKAKNTNPQQIFFTYEVL